MSELVFRNEDELVMKLLHYFITEQGYSPIILHGVKDEIWLENLDGDYKIVRIVSNYIHNDEQFKFDIFKTKKIMKKIKLKTLSWKLNSLNLFVNLGDNVNLENHEYDNVTCAKITNFKDLKKYDFINKYFPTIDKENKYSEDGLELFLKLTNDISEKNEVDARQADDVFTPKKPIITYVLLIINILVYLLTSLLSGSFINMNGIVLYNFGAMFNEAVINGEYYRLITSAFLHGGIFHIAFNMYALYIIGPQLESFLGKVKYLVVYLFSAISGNLLSMMFTTGLSVGASGAIFGLLGSLLYFGYHYRVYLGNVMRSQIIPLIIINLGLGFVISNVDVAAHFGGLLGGLFITIALGIKYKSTKIEQINGWLVTLMFVGFLIYGAFIMG